MARKRKKKKKLSEKSRKNFNLITNLIKTFVGITVLVLLVVAVGFLAHHLIPIHEKPVYEVDGVRHYAVANMPGAYPRTSTLAITAVTMPYILDLAKNDLKAVKKSKPLQLGVNMHKGEITYKPVAEAFKMKYTPLEKVL